MLRRSQAELVDALENHGVLTHSAVIGELACGNLKNRTQLLDAIQPLPGATEATDKFTGGRP